MAEPSPSTTTLSMPLEEAMRTQRAIRRLKPDPVDDALVLHLIELALRAPTGSNAQNWQFIVVKDPAVKARLGKMNRQAWRLYGGIGRRMAQNDPPMLRIIEAVQWQADHFEEIPVVVVACLTGMAARAAGLGACLITLPLWNTFMARRALGLPWTVTPCAVIPLGWPRGRYGPTTRKPVGEVVHLDRWGNQPFRR
jgi:nitroreductase